MLLVVRVHFILTMISKLKKIWCEEEDEALQQLYTEDQEKSWSNIAKRLSTQFDFARKSAKQCRERFENHIENEGFRKEWNEEEELKLVEFHNEMGNKWSLIAQNIPGKNDNCIKNHFYSKLRKILRKLNSIIYSYLKKEFRQINIGTLYKIIEATEQRFQEEPSCGFEVSVACQEVQNKMLHVSMLKEEEFDSEERISIYADLVRDIYRVSKLYKRKSKKIRNAAIQAPNTKRKKIRDQSQVIITKEKQEQGYESDSSSIFEEEAPVIPFRKPEVKVEEQESNIRDMLKDAGLLKEEQDDGGRSVFRFSSRSSFRSYSQNNNIQSANQFFEDSQNEFGLSKHKRTFPKFRGKLIDDPSGGSEREGFEQAIG